jgi:hypothetical protein
MDAIILVGGGANLPGLAEYFEFKLGISTVAKGLFENPRFIGAHAENDRGIEIAVAVGLSMGLSPAKSVVRNPKPMKAISETTATPPRAPKPPKPPKPTKGKTFKVTRQATDEATEAINNNSEERVEVAAIATPTPEITIPAAFTPQSAPDPAEAPKSLVDETAEKYGAEVAALLGGTVLETPVASKPVEVQEDVAALLNSAFEEPMPVAKPAPVAPMAETANAFDEKAALLDTPVMVAPTAASAKAEKTSVFSRFAKPEKEAKVKPEKAAKAAKAEKPAKARKEQYVDEDSDGGFKSKVGSAVKWMFGSPTPKEHVKPTGQLAPTANRPMPQAPAEQPQVELLRGAELEAVDLTLREAKPAPTVNPPAPRVLEAAAEPAKPKARKAPAPKKPQASETAKAPKKEAA